jgi:hypothetical protein
MFAMQSHAVVNPVLSTTISFCGSWALFLLLFVIIGFIVLKSSKPLDGKKKTIEIRSDRIEVGDDVQVIHDGGPGNFSAQFGTVVRSLKGTPRGIVQFHMDGGSYARDVGGDFFEVDLDGD